jgi:arginyl-tRNA synthetase
MVSIRKQLEKAVSVQVDKMLKQAGKDGEKRVQVEPTVHREHGDYATNAAMIFASILRRPPLQISEEIRASIKLPWVKQIEVARPGFLNFFIDWGKWFTQSPTRFEAEPKQEKIVVEHTSINPNKAAHIGHLRNACIGDSLARLLKRAGWNVEVHNYIDDLGNQVADTVVAMHELRFSGKVERFSDFCWDLYAEVNQAYKRGTLPEARRKEVLAELEEGDNTTAWLGALVAERNVRDHLEDMALFGIWYDLLVWESDIVREGFWEKAFAELKTSPLFRKETEGPYAGCWILKQEQADEHGGEGRQDKVLVRSNGVLTYTAKDIAYHLWKFGRLGKDFSYRPFAEGLWTTARTGEQRPFGKADAVLNVIDVRQEYPQAMVKLALKTLGHEKEAERLSHISYGVVSLSPNTAARLGIDTSEKKSSYPMSGRQGIGIKISDLIKQMTEIVDRVRPRNEGLSSREIAAAAIRYYLLKYNLTTEIVFDLDQAADLQGNSGVYLMYQHARAAKLLRDGLKEKKIDRVEEEWFTKLLPEEEALLRALANWPDLLMQAAIDYQITPVASFAYELASSFSKFYRSAPILKTEEPHRTFRLWLVQQIKDTLADAYQVLGIPAPEQM